MNNDVVEEPAPSVTPKTVEADNEWYVMLPKLNLGGMAQQLAEHCLLKELTVDKLVLLLESSGVTLKTRLTEEALQEALNKYLGRSVTVEYEAVEAIAETPTQRRVRHGQELQQQAEQSIAGDPFVQQLKQDYGGVVLPGSVRPNGVKD